mmetsp:Transcript_27424/g.88546  ORF Transcript_27424/g.88546 Transcript_27424/m.88546 type:complete len:222 (+) Transcript_27424:54-719(+)
MQPTTLAPDPGRISRSRQPPRPGRFWGGARPRRASFRRARGAGRRSSPHPYQKAVIAVYGDTTQAPVWVWKAQGFVISVVEIERLLQDREDAPRRAVASRAIRARQHGASFARVLGRRIFRKEGGASAPRDAELNADGGDAIVERGRDKKRGLLSALRLLHWTRLRFLWRQLVCPGDIGRGCGRRRPNMRIHAGGGIGHRWARHGSATTAQPCGAAPNLRN